MSSQALAEDSTWHGWLDSQCQSPMADVQNLEWPDGAPKLGSLGLKVFSWTSISSVAISIQTIEVVLLQLDDHHESWQGQNLAKCLTTCIGVAMLAAPRHGRCNACDLQ